MATRKSWNSTWGLLSLFSADLDNLSPTPIFSFPTRLHLRGCHTARPSQETAPQGLGTRDRKGFGPKGQGKGHGRGRCPGKEGGVGCPQDPLVGLGRTDALVPLSPTEWGTQDILGLKQPRCPRGHNEHDARTPLNGHCQGQGSFCVLDSLARVKPRFVSIITPNPRKPGIYTQIMAFL